ncbi:MAG: hypothetical protein ACJATP_003710, partial [Candidatus Azotimanducaceae bacterium]
MCRYLASQWLNASIERCGEVSLIYHCSRRLRSASRLAKDEEGVEKKREKEKKGV